MKLVETQAGTGVNSLLAVAIISTVIKVLLIPSYRSTDFEVHRNWLAITHNLGLNYWYFETTSEWTLDYPPFFAYFEWVLSLVASFIDPSMLEISKYGYASQNVVYFQRGSVIVSDVVLLYSTYRLSNPTIINDTVIAEKKLIIFSLIAFNCGLYMVDHIHFQYNGMLIGLLILCHDFANRQYYNLFTLTFSILVLSKHLNIYLAPLFGLFVLSKTCFIKINDKTRFIWSSFLQLLTSSVLPVLIAFVPFVIQPNGYSQLKQIFTRLFPFGRGLVHSYWAPNAYALYCGADKILKYIAVKHFHMQLASSTTVGVSSSSGLVGNFQFYILPSISPIMSLSLILILQSPALYKIWKSPTKSNLMRCSLYCSLTSFYFGYHAHEKAIIVSQILASLMCMKSSQDFVLFLLITSSGFFSLFPLLFQLNELPIKLFLYATYTAVSYRLISRHVTLELYSKRLMICVSAILTTLFIFTEIVHPLYFTTNKSLEFLSLMATSIICSIILLFSLLLSLKLIIIGV